MLKTTDEVKPFLAEATFPQPCFIEQMELRVVIRSLSCRFAVLVTSGLKIIPRCSECMAYASPQEYLNEEVANSHFDINVKVEHDANDDDECGKSTDEEECSNTDESGDERREDDHAFNETRTKSTEPPDIKIVRDKMAEPSSSKGEEKNIAECDNISDDQTNLIVGSSFCSVPIIPENPIKSIASPECP